MKKFEVKDYVSIVIALILTGLGIAAQHPEAVMSIVAVLLIWGINWLFTWKGITIHRAWLTTSLFVIALGLTYLFQPALFPPFPVLIGTSNEIANAIWAWVGALIIASGPVVAYATGLYNILLQRVLDKLKYQPKLLS